MGGGEKAREPSRYSSDAPKPMAPEDPGARAAKPRVILPETLAADKDFRAYKTPSN
jgi:hypothetical protein